MQEIRKMVEDYKVLNQPAGFALKEYMEIRDSALQQMIAYNPTVTQLNWVNVDASYALRQYLFNEGNRIVAEKPAFGSLWQNVLKKEFQTKDIVPTVEASK